MKALYFLSLLLLLGLATATAQVTPNPPYDLRFNLSSAAQMNIQESPAGSGFYNITTTGADARVFVESFMPGPYDPSEVYVISFDYFAGPGLDDLEIFYGLPVSAARKASFEDLPPTPNGLQTFKAFMIFEVDNWNSSFQSLRFDISKRAGASVRIGNIQLREPTPGEVIPLTLDLAAGNQVTTTTNADGSVSLTTTGGDPFIPTTDLGVAYDPATTFVVSYDYTTPQGTDIFQTFFGFPWAGNRKADFAGLTASPDPQSFLGSLEQGSGGTWGQTAPVDKLRFDFGRNAGVDATVSNFYLREPTFSELPLFAPEPVVDTAFIELDVTNTSGNVLSAEETAPGAYRFTTNGNDPWVRALTVTDNYDIANSYILEYEYRTVEGYNELQLFFGPPITGAQTFTAPDALDAAPEWTTKIINPRLLVDNFQDNTWTEFRFDFGRQENAEKVLEIRNIIIRPPTEQELTDEQNSDKFRSRADNLAFNQYRTRSYADRVTDVAVDATEVTISGTVSGSGPYFLAEVDPEDYGFNQETYDNLIPLAVSGGEFTVSQPRFVALADRNKDRLYARWVVVTDDGDGTYTKTSPLAWATDIVRVAEHNLAEDKAATIKGLDGLTAGTFSNFDDLIDLDIKSMKINLLLHGTLTLTPNPTGATHEFNGKTYYINQNFVDRLDQSIKACTDNDIKPAVVLLIPISFNNPLADSIWTHPDASLGLYSMANVTDARGVEYYTAAVDYLAQRYSRPDSLYGRLDQWIIHNEVDAHTSWTHAGQKPAPLYTQIYDRSMRLVHYTLRKYNPTAKVFTSFTKHFASKVGGENGPNFRSKEILTTLNNQMRLEGDYEWGIGWHSYPTNLRNPAVWNDAIAATPLNFNAPQITPRNLEVIDAYVRQEALLYNGKKVRTILLSENGFSSNTNTNPTFTQERQAAAVAYFWKKTDQRLPAVENIQYHRWVDNPNEGGLEFGLWTVEPGTVQGFGEKKESWYVWEAAGTVEEDDVFAPYLSTIGISDWSEIQFDFPTETTPYRVDMTIANCDADLADVLVSFNGEHKFPQADGTVTFYNVASNVDQPLVIRKGDVIQQQDVLQVSEDLVLNFDLGQITELTAYSPGSTTVELSWVGADAGATYTIERKAGTGGFAAIGQSSTTEYVDATVTSGQDYTYRVAQVLADGTTLGCYSDEVTVTAAYIIVDYRNGDLNKPDNSKITPILRLRNESDQAVDLDELTVRYWFNTEDPATLHFFVDGAISFSDAIDGSFTVLTPELEGANHYLEIAYDGTGFAIPGNGATESMRYKISQQQRPDLDETNDYSYGGNIATLTQTDRITVYRNGTLIWGIEPGPAAGSARRGETVQADLSAGEAAGALVRVFPNPARGQVDLLLPATSTARLHGARLIDARGVPVAVRPEVLASGLRFPLRGLAAGVYFLRFQLDGESMVRRVLVVR